MDFAETVDKVMPGVPAFGIPKRFDKMEICHSFASPVGDGRFLEKHYILSDHNESYLSGIKH